MLLEKQASRVYAIPLSAGLFGTIVKNMTKVRPAVFTSHLYTVHAKTHVVMKFYICKIGGLRKRRPSGAGIKFSVRRKKQRPAGGTLIYTLRVFIPILAGKR